MAQDTHILYCRCAYAQVVPQEVKDEVLKGLCQASAPFESVSDLCEMSARNDPSLKKLIANRPVKIAACYPRAVRWMFHAAGASLPDETGQVEVLNMREEEAESILTKLINP